MKKIYLEITPFFPSQESFRGPFIYDQIQALLRTGTLDDVIVLRPSDSDSEYEYKGIKVYLFKTKALPSNILPGLFDDYNQKSFLKRLQSLQIQLSDIVVAHSHVAGQALYVNAIKKLNPQTYTIIQYHDPDPFSIRLGRLKNQTWHRKIVAKHNINLCSAVDLQVGVSQKALNNVLSFPYPVENEKYNEYRNLLKGMDKINPLKAKNTYVLYNGVDKSLFYPEKNQREKSIFRIGCVANFVDWKDQITLIKAVELILEKDKHTELILIGTGVYLKSCQDYVVKQGLEKHISFQTEVNHQQLREFYNTLDLFVLPSYFEGFGCVFLEAYACGTPFMTCYDQGISEYIIEKEKNRWLFALKDYTGLATLIIQYKKERYKQLLAKPYDINILIKEFIKHIHLC
jgi:glycosyltransferase involved in cell wall biosynthesis